MAKILISPLGVGGKFNGQNSHDREYQEAQYQIDDKPYPSSRFMASVLYQHFQLDGIIFIGTVKSMWEEVYRFFCEKNEQSFDEHYWLQLATTVDKLDHKSPLNSLNLTSIKEVLGSRSECILIKYGLNDTELWENFDQIFQIINLLQAGDEIYIDITHSFRSLSLFLFLVLNFLSELVSEKEIKVSGVYYGMLDVSREIGYTPVVNLKPLFDLTSWIKGAYDLKNYGNGELIASLLEHQNERQIAEQIRMLSQAININYVTDIKQRSSTLKSVLGRTKPIGPFKHLRKILEGFTQKFARTSMSESEYQLELAKWYFDNQRYATGYITIAEAIITYLCDINGKEPQNRENRKEMQDQLHTPINKDSDLAKLYFKINRIRNSIAHASLDTDMYRISFSEAILNAKSYYQEVKRIFKTKTINQ